MKLQLAIDFATLEEAKALACDLKDIVDIIECGTPLLIREGIRAVSEMKGVTDALILADLKIMDAGEHESRIAYQAGADIVTVLGVADDSTITGVVDEARRHGKYVMVDMIAVTDMEARAAEVDKLGVDYICVHTAVDVQGTGKNPLHELVLAGKTTRNAKMAVAGGVNMEMLAQIIPHKPEIVVVGSGVTGKADKRQAALDMKRLMK